MILAIWKSFSPTEGKILTWEGLAWILGLFISFNLAKTWKNANIFFCLLLPLRILFSFSPSLHRSTELHSGYNTVLGFEAVRKTMTKSSLPCGRLQSAWKKRQVPWKKSTKGLCSIMSVIRFQNGPVQGSESAGFRLARKAHSWAGSQTHWQKFRGSALRFSKPLGNPWCSPRFESLRYGWFRSEEAGSVMWKTERNRNRLWPVSSSLDFNFPNHQVHLCINNSLYNYSSF